MEFARRVIAIYDDFHEANAWKEKCRTHLMPNLCVFPESVAAFFLSN